MQPYFIILALCLFATVSSFELARQKRNADEGKKLPLNLVKSNVHLKEI
jgi:hypothetical protein